MGVEKVCLPDIDRSTTDRLDELVARFPGWAYAMTGLHPCSVKDNYKTEIAHIQEQLANKPVIAIGEIGLDYYWDKTFVKEQNLAFREQVELARAHSLPIVIHSRDSLDDTISTIEELTKGDLRGIFHCFNGTMAQAQRIVNAGFLVGLGGVITFKKVDMDETLRWLPEGSFVLETDSPYLAPAPYRGKRNSSEYIPLIGEYLARVRNVDIEDIASMTSDAAKKLFRFPSSVQ